MKFIIHIFPQILLNCIFIYFIILKVTEFHTYTLLKDYLRKFLPDHYNWNIKLALSAIIITLCFIRSQIILEKLMSILN
jgi:hypothetical protein